jgi:hypothetical protein
MKSVLLDMEDNKTRWKPSFADALGIDRGRGTVVQSLCAPDEVKSGADGQPRQEELMGRNPVH